MRDYVVQTMTGEGFGNGTDTMVYINLVGTLGDSGKRFLVHNMEGTEKFQTGEVNSSGAFLLPFFSSAFKSNRLFCITVIQLAEFKS